MNTKTNPNPHVLNSKYKNIVVSGESNSGKTSLALSLAECLKTQNKKVLFCEFDREKYVLYGKDVNLTTDVILKNALFSCSNTKTVSDLEDCLCENTTLIIDNFDISYPSPYMRHLFTLSCKVIVFSRCDMKNLDKDVEHITLSRQNCADACCLNEKESELLISLCCMLYYLEPTTKIVSSKSGVFDGESVKLYLAGLEDALDSLILKNLVTIQNDGKISISRSVGEYVMKKLKPKISQMPVFNRYLQRVKYVPDNNELFDITTYLALKDENCLCDSLKMLISDAAEGKKNRVFHRNIAHFVSMFTHERLAGNLDLYSFCAGKLKTKDISPLAMSCLCKIKICCHALVGKTTDMYKADTLLIQLLRDSMQKVLVLDNDEKEYVSRLATDCCKNFLLYHSSIFPDGTYKAFRENAAHHEISAFPDEYCNQENANSVCFAYSRLTIELYLCFQKLLSVFSDKYESQIQEISVHFWRVVKGYNVFYDFFDKKYTKRIGERDKERLSDKIILDNKRYFERGFDCKTKIGSRKYAKMIVDAINTSKNPLSLIYLVINPEFLLCDETYKNLLEIGFVKLVRNCKNISNLSKQDLLETLILNYNERSFCSHLKKLYISLIEMLEIETSQNETSLKSLSDSVCRMYIVNALNNVYCNELFEMYCKRTIKNRTPEEIVAKALFDYQVKKIKPKDKTRISHAIDCVEKQYKMADMDVDEQRFREIKKTIAV